MDLAHPARDVLGENRARVLHTLAILAQEESGRRIHALSGIASLRTTQRVLDHLERTGLVRVHSIGPAHGYSLNRDHVLWSPVESLLNASARLESEIARVLEDQLGPLTILTALFGSVARGVANHESDIDILVITNDNVDERSLTETLDKAGDEIERLSGNTPQFFVTSRSDLRLLEDSESPILMSLRRDARQLTGFATELAEVLAST